MICQNINNIDLKKIEFFAIDIFNQISLILLLINVYEDNWSVKKISSLYESVSYLSSLNLLSAAQFCGDSESATDNYDFQLLFIISLSLLNYKANI